jgi:hypothetical protein
MTKSDDSPTRWQFADMEELVDYVANLFEIVLSRVIQTSGDGRSVGRMTAACKHLHCRMAINPYRLDHSEKVIFLDCIGR